MRFAVTVRIWLHHDAFVDVPFLASGPSWYAARAALALAAGVDPDDIRPVRS